MVFSRGVSEVLLSGGRLPETQIPNRKEVRTNETSKSRVRETGAAHCAWWLRRWLGERLQERWLGERLQERWLGKRLQELTPW